MPRCAQAGASLPGPLAPSFPPALGDGRLLLLAQPAAGRPQLGGGGGGDASSSGGRRARGAGGGGGGRRPVQFAFSFLSGHGRAGAAGPPPAAPRRGGCRRFSPAPPVSRRLGADSGPATLAAAARWPAASSPPRAPGGGRRSAPRRACCGRRAGAQPGGGGGGASLSPLPRARAGALAPRPRHWERATGKRQRRPAERPPRDRRRRRVFPAPPPGAGVAGDRRVRGCGSPARAWARSATGARGPRPGYGFWASGASWLGPSAAGSLLAPMPLRIFLFPSCRISWLPLLFTPPPPSTHPTSTP